MANNTLEIFETNNFGLETFIHVHDIRYESSSRTNSARVTGAICARPGWMKSSRNISRSWLTAKEGSRTGMYKLVERYAASYKAGGASDVSAAHCAEVLNRILRQLEQRYGVEVGEDTLSGLTPSVLDGYYNHLSVRCKMTTRNNYVCMLNPFLRWAWKVAQAVPEDLSSVLTTHKLPNEKAVPKWERKEKYMTVQQTHKLLGDMPGRNKLRDRAICMLILESGMRVSELCALTIGDVLDGERGKIYCRRKGGNWEDIYVKDSFYDVLDAYLKTRPDAADHSRPLFLSTHGEPMNRKTVYKALSFKQKQLGLVTGPHCLRHTFISEVEKRNGAGVARDCANHSSLRVTNRYDHSHPEQLSRAVNTLPW